MCRASLASPIVLQMSKTFTSIVGFFSHPITPVCCSPLRSAAWISAGMPWQYSLNEKLEKGRKKKRFVTKSGKSFRPSQPLWKCPWPSNNVSLVPVWNASNRGGGEKKKGGRDITYSRNFWVWLPSKLICEQELSFYQLPSPSGTGKGC